MHSKFFSLTSRRSVLFGLLSGVLAGTSYIPFPPWAIFFCYVPLLIHFFLEPSAKENLIAAWVAQFTLTIIGFHWVAYTAHEFAQIPWVLSILVLLAFASCIHLYVPFSFLVGAYLRKKLNLNITSSLLIVTTLMIISERFWPVIFPWHYGYTFLWAKWPMYQWADVIGFYGLSAFVYLANALIFLIWLHRHDRVKAIKLGVVFVFTFAILNFSGLQHGKTISNGDTHLKFLAVQANIGNLERIYAEKGKSYQTDITDRHIVQTGEAIKRMGPVDVVVWPESAFPDFLDQSFLERTRQTSVRMMARDLNTPLLAGAFSKEEGIKDRDLSIFNAFFSINKEGNLSSPAYRKSMLLAFGEYLPLSETFPWLKKLIPFVSNFGRGPGPQTVRLEAKNEIFLVGPQICYEGLDPEFSRSMSLQGAQVMVNVTNDSWFGSTFEPSQHLYMTLARAVENRIPLLRSTNTGITTAILANGKILEKSPLHEVWAGTYDIEFHKNHVKTIYTRYGQWDQWIYLFIFLFVVFKGVYRVRSRQR